MNRKSLFIHTINGDNMNKEDYYKMGFTDTGNYLDYLKYGLLNEYGLNLDRINNYYKEENIIKRKCNIKKNSGK